MLCTPLQVVAYFCKRPLAKGKFSIAKVQIMHWLLSKSFLVWKYGVEYGRKFWCRIEYFCYGIEKNCQYEIWKNCLPFPYYAVTVFIFETFFD